MWRQPWSSFFERTTTLLPKFGTNDGRTDEKKKKHGDETCWRGAVMRLFFQDFCHTWPSAAPTAARRLTFTSRYCSLDNFPSSFTPHEVGLENRLFDRVRAPFPITSFFFDTYFDVFSESKFGPYRPPHLGIQRKLVNGRSYFPCWLLRKVLLNDLCKPISR